MAGQNRDQVRIEGTVTNIAHQSGEFTGSRGDAIAYDFHEVTLMRPDGRGLSVVRIPKNAPVGLPVVGDRVSYLCDMRISGQNLKAVAESVTDLLYADLLREVSPDVLPAA